MTKMAIGIGIDAALWCVKDTYAKIYLLMNIWARQSSNKDDITRLFCKDARY